MNPSPVRWIARLRSIRHALGTLDALPGHPLLILPTTQSALLLARELCMSRSCYVMEGPISRDAQWNFGPLLRTPTEIVHAFSGMPQLPRTIISFPDQTFGNDLSFAWMPFLGTRYSFSVIDALLALRHGPQVFTLRTCTPFGDFGLVEIAYADLVDTEIHAASLHKLMLRLLEPLENELANPPADWLAARWLARKSEAHWCSATREDLKDVECLLRLHLLSPTCDRLRAGTAVAAVVARQKRLVGAGSP